MTRLATLLLLTGAIAACAAVPGGPVTTNQTVTFNVQLDANAFSNKRQISVRLYDAAQLAIAEETAQCNVSYDAATGQEKTSCPPGVTYRPTTPEEWTVSRDQLAAGLTLDSKTVTVGERYRLSIGGMAPDDCNTASASQEGVAGGASIRLSNMPVAQTEMACEPTR